jgi:phenylpropionate dioxygenase-like ring-hydroxylating dioxygenase large terminal subunit
MHDEEARGGLAQWKRYDAAAEGFREYWYPVMVARELRGKPVARRIAGDDLVLVREHGRAFALADRCPHRGIPLSIGKRDAPGHLTCRYHGWMFDVSTGRLVAALTDGPSSPIVGKVCVRTYPVEERCGMLWVWMGRRPPVPVEQDIPEELLAPDAQIAKRFVLAAGNWRYATENGFDEAHGKYLHRDSLWMAFKRIPAWNQTRIVESEDGLWITRRQEASYAQDEYPVVNRWPRFHVWQRPQGNIVQTANNRLSLRLPGILRVLQPGSAGWTHYEWYVPVDRTHYLYLQLAVAWTRGLGALKWWLRYWSYIRWLHHGEFNNQDLRIVRLMPETHPERLFRPDVSITAWRRLAETRARDYAEDSAPAVPELVRG